MSTDTSDRELLELAARALLPCPFCGNPDPVLIEHPAHTHVIATFMPDHHGSWTLECVACNVGMIEDEPGAKDRIIERWNRRAALSSLSSETEAIAAWMIAHGYATGHGDTAEDLLSELVAQVSGGDGMVRVPREPSETMIDAAFDATVWPDLSRATSSDVIASLRENMRKEYRAMVAATEIGRQMP